MRILGIDYGDRRIGLAVSDPTQTAVTGLPTLHWDGQDLEAVCRELSGILAGYAEDGSPVGRIVLGIPLRTDGTEGPAAQKIRRFGERLAQTFDTPVDVYDERHTTEESRAALRPTGWSGKKKKAKLDMMSALLILRGYLDARRPDPPRPERT